MGFDFTSSLSSNATNKAARWKNIPPFHFIGGNIDEPSVPAEALADAVSTALRREGNAMGKYGMNSGPQGNLALREFIVKNLKDKAATEASADDVLVTTGSMQAMELVFDAFLDKGDTIILEGANYGGAISAFKRRGINHIGIELDEGGMRMDKLREALEELKSKGIKPKFIYTIPTVQNPTGTVMSVERRREMLAIAKEFDLPIFEDDCYADLIWEGERPPAIQSMDDEGRVIYCATFSKTIAPALRVGYIVAPWSILQHILPLKIDAGSGMLEQMALAEYLPDNFDKHVEQVRGIFKEKCDTMVAALNENFGATAEFSAPKGGIYIWVTLPEHVDTRQLAAAAAAEGLAINPGPEWSVVGEENKHRMRLCFGHPSLETIKVGIAKLADVCFQEFGVPTRSGNISRG